MKKKFIVKSSKDFQKVIDNGCKIFTKEYIIYYLNTNLGYSRVGISVGKKMLKRAVDRNYEKRITKEIMRDIYSNIASSYDIIIICRKASLSLSFAKRKQVLTDIFTNKLLMEEENAKN